MRGGRTVSVNIWPPILLTSHLHVCFVCVCQFLCTYLYLLQWLCITRLIDSSDLEITLMIADYSNYCGLIWWLWITSMIMDCSNGCQITAMFVGLLQWLWVTLTIVDYSYDGGFSDCELLWWLWHCSVDCHVIVVCIYAVQSMCVSYFSCLRVVGHRTLTTTWHQHVLVAMVSVVLQYRSQRHRIEVLRSFICSRTDKNLSLKSEFHLGSCHHNISWYYHQIMSPGSFTWWCQFPMT